MTHPNVEDACWPKCVAKRPAGEQKTRVATAQTMNAGGRGGTAARERNMLIKKRKVSACDLRATSRNSHHETLGDCTAPRDHPGSGDYKRRSGPEHATGATAPAAGQRAAAPRPRATAGRRLQRRDRHPGVQTPSSTPPGWRTDVRPKGKQSTYDRWP